MNNVNPIFAIIAAIVIVGALIGGGLGSIVEFAVFVAWVFGFIKGWQAHPLLGIAAFIVAPIGAIIGALSFALGRNVALDIVQAFNR
jgi:hypothetical protein